MIVVEGGGSRRLVGAETPRVVVGLSGLRAASEPAFSESDSYGDADSYDGGGDDCVEGCAEGGHG